MLELLSILCYRLPSLSELEELYFFGIPHTIREILIEEFPPECLLRHWFLPLFHDGFHADPPMLRFPDEHVYYEGQSVLCRAHFCIKNTLQVLQPLVCGIKTSLPIKLHRVVLQEVFQALLPDCRSWLRTKYRGNYLVLLQLLESFHMLLVAILRSYPSSLHLLHHQLLLLKRHCLSLHQCFMLLQHRRTLLCHSSHHRFYCSGDIKYVSLR